eukprot:scaffold35608_cov261-Skeletonema_dohrnii-CCMP3373.AAC.2
MHQTTLAAATEACVALSISGGSYQHFSCARYQFLPSAYVQGSTYVRRNRYVMSRGCKKCDISEAMCCG